MMIRSVSLLLGTFVVLVLLSGCGSGNEYPTGVVEGSLTLKGKPVSENVEIFFISQQTGAAYKALVQDDGSFKVKQPVRTGNYVAYVQPAVPPVMDMNAPPQRAAALNTIPVKYSNDSLSDLRAEVQEGTNTFHFEMK